MVLVQRIVPQDVRANRASRCCRSCGRRSISLARNVQTLLLRPGADLDSYLGAAGGDDGDQQLQQHHGGHAFVCLCVGCGYGPARCTCAPLPGAGVKRRTRAQPTPVPSAPRGVKRKPTAPTPAARHVSPKLNYAAMERAVSEPNTEPNTATDTETDTETNTEPQHGNDNHSHSSSNSSSSTSYLDNEAILSDISNNNSMASELSDIWPCMDE